MKKNFNKNKVRVIGGGLAGSEAALTLAKYGYQVILIDMKPQKFTDAHKSKNFAELVCSNTFKSKLTNTAPGIQKAELELLDSELLKIAKQVEVSAGSALAVDRELFSKQVSDMIRQSPNIEIISEEVKSLPDDDILTIIATGPLTGEDLFNDISSRLKNKSLHFFDAVAPIVEADSIDMSIAFKQSRYDKGTADYINCPFSKKEYDHFYTELLNAELAEVKGYDKEILFEACMPVESMARRGYDTLRYGPLKPVGLTNPHKSEKPYAVVQLRQENAYASMYNMVGFQTRLKWSEQKRVFSLIPGLENANFLRYGVMHRNSFIPAGNELDAGFNLKSNTKYLFAGQITGLEGYLCAISSGLLAALSSINILSGNNKVFLLPETTIHGQLARYVSNPDIVDYQPMAANLGLLPPLEKKIRNKQERGEALYQRAIQDLKAFICDKIV